VTKSTGGWLPGSLLPDGGGVEDAEVWWALTPFCGIDLRHAEHGPYLHDDEQIRDWLKEFRARCAETG
jgi:hypothetical protein